MELSIPVTPTLLKKLQVLNILSGGDDGADFTTMLSTQVEHVVEAMIQEKLDGISVSPKQENAQFTWVKGNKYSVDNGLSNEEFFLDESEDDDKGFEHNPPPTPTPNPTNVTKVPPKQKLRSKSKKPIKSNSSGVTREMLYTDTAVENPKTEAVSSDSLIVTFEELMGVSSSSHEDEQLNDTPLFEIPELLATPSPRVSGKKLPKDCRAVVTEYGGGEANTF